MNIHNYLSSTGWLHRYTFQYIGNNLAERIRELLFYRMMQQEIGFFDHNENSVGALASRLQTDASLIRGAVGDSIGVVFQYIATIVGCLVVAFIAGGAAWKLGLVIFACLPLFVFAAVAQRQFMMGKIL